MDKVSGVFERMLTFENFYDGFRLASRSKRYKPEVLNYTAHLESNIIDSIESLVWHTYSIDKAHEFYEYFPKKRIITAWSFRCRVVNCAAYNVLWPIYSRSFYEHSYGSVPGMGQIKAVNQLQQWMQIVSHKPQKWYLGKADVQKFFFRVPHEVQLRELGKPLDDPDMMWFLETCIKGDGRPTGLPLECGDPTEAERIFGIGMPVGSLISQTTANVVLTPLDHYMKRVIRVPYYIRYMDDMILLAPSKQEVWDALGYMDDFLRSDLGLQLNNKTQVMEYDAGVEFIGRVIKPYWIGVRKSSSLQMKRHLRWVAEAYHRGEVPEEYAMQVITSYYGLLKHTSCRSLEHSIFEQFSLINPHPEELEDDTFL